MLNRREFLSTASGGFVTLLLTPIITACGSDSSSGGTTATTNPTNPTPACDGAGETSTVTNGHTHTLCVPLADLNNPPAAGATYTTSTTELHQHSVTLTLAQLTMIAQGQTVAITSSNFLGHNHDFAVQRMATAGSVSPPVTGPFY